MSIERQLSIFIANESGALAHLAKRLAHVHVNILALSVPESSGQGVLRLIVDDTNQAKALLKKEGIPFAETQVLALAMHHEPGALFDVARRLSRAGIDITYAYGTTPADGTDTMVIFHVSDLSRAEKLFEHKDRGRPHGKSHETTFVNRSMR